MKTTEINYRMVANYHMTLDQAIEYCKNNNIYSARFVLQHLTEVENGFNVDEISTKNGKKVHYFFLNKEDHKY